MLEWYAHGRGDATQAFVDRQFLFEGEWEAGRYYTYNFEVELPPGPYTYHGKYLNVDWRLKAEADISWSTGRPTAEQELILEPSGNESSFRLAGDRREDETVSTSGDEPVSVSGLLMAILLLTVGLIFLPVAIMGEHDGAWIFSLGLLSVGGWLLFQSVRNALAEQRLGNVDVQLSATEVHPGETLHCRVGLIPSGTVQLNKITVLLRGYEQVVTDSGSEECLYTHVVTPTGGGEHPSSGRTARLRHRTPDPRFRTVFRLRQGQ